MRAALRARNAYWLVIKNFPLTIAARHGPALAFVLTRRFYQTFRGGHRAQATKAVIGSLGKTPRMARKRRFIQSTRRVDDAKLMSILSPDPDLGSQKIKRLRSILSRPGSTTARLPN